MNFKICFSFLLLIIQSYCSVEEDDEERYCLIDCDSRPSPINLDRNSMIRRTTWTPLYFSSEHSLKTKLHKKAKNGGLQVTFDYAGNKPTISGGVLKSTYQFEKLFLHWSNNSNAAEGSYHTIDGMYYAMEIQAYYDLVPKFYTFLPDIFPKFFHKSGEDAVIISQLFEIGKEDNTFINDIIQNKKESTLEKVFPRLETYATYKGSSVITPFSKNVKWIVSLTPQKISKFQLDMLRNITTSGEVRPIQPLYGRKVWYVFSKDKWF